MGFSSIVASAISAATSMAAIKANQSTAAKTPASPAAKPIEKIETSAKNLRLQQLIHLHKTTTPLRPIKK